jgi:hypothetical protein
MASHNLSAAPSTGGSNERRNDIATGFWEISVSPVDAATSSELKVDMYPTSYGALLPAGPMAI